MEALIYLKNNIHPNPIKDRSGSWKRGMVVVVNEDGHTWGRLESKAQWVAEGNPSTNWPSQGMFGILKIPGLSATKALELISTQEVDDAGNPYEILGDDGSGNIVPIPTKFRRRAWQFKINNIPANIRNQVINNGEVTVTLAQVRNFLRRIRDDVRYTGLD